MKKREFAIILISTILSCKSIAQVTPPSPNHEWIKESSVLREGQRVIIPGHWERKKAMKSSLNVKANPDKTGEFFIEHNTPDTSPKNTDQQKSEPIDDNNTNGTSSAKVIRGGGSREKRGGTPTDKIETFCFKQEMNTNKISDKYGLIANRSEIYPGSIVNGKNFINGNYEIVSKPLNAIKLYIPNVIFTDPTKAIQIVQNPDRASLSTAVLPMVNNTFEGKVQADMQFESSEVLSRADMKLNCNIHAEGFFIDVSNVFSLTTAKYSTTIMLSFVQKYFTVAAQMPTPDSIFKDGSLPDDDMMYIRSVTYGRRGVLFITIDSSATTLIDTLKANYDALVKHVSLTADLMKSDKFKGSKVTGYVYGGGAGEASKIFNPDPLQCVQEFFTFLHNGAEFSKENFGRPIEYEVAFLKTDELACIEYDIKETRKVCDAGSKLLRVTLKDIKAVKVDDGGSDHQGDFYGVIGVYYQLPDAPVTISSDKRFYKKAETTTPLPYFDTERGGDLAKIILPKDGKTSIPPNKNLLWTVKRSSNVKISTGGNAEVGKSVDFLYTPGTSLDKLVFFANIDEADDDPDDNMEGLMSSDEVMYVELPAEGQKKNVKQRVRDSSPSGTLLELNYVIEYAPLY